MYFITLHYYHIATSSRLLTPQPPIRDNPFLLEPSSHRHRAARPFVDNNSKLWKQFSFENISLNLDIKIILVHGK